MAHDLYASVFRREQASEASEIRVSRYATIVLGLLAVGLGIAFQNQNVAYMVSLAFSIATSSTLPLLILVMYWPGLTTRGAVTGGCVCALSGRLPTARCGSRSPRRISRSNCRPKYPGTAPQRRRNTTRSKSCRC